MSTDPLPRPSAPAPPAGGTTVRYGAPVWLIVDGREPIPPSLGRTATELMRSGQRVTVVIALPRTRRGRTEGFAGSAQRRADPLPARYRELAAGLTDGGRVQVRVSRPSRATDWRRRWQRWSQWRKGSPANPATVDPALDDPLDELLGLTVEPMAVRRSRRGGRQTAAAGNPP